MLTQLPKTIDPLRLAKQAETLTGRYEIHQLPRLHDRLCELRGHAEFNWSFSLNEEQQILIQGWIRALLPMICERCLQPVDYVLTASTALMVLRPGQSEDQVPDEFEALLLTQMPVSLLSLVEDELVLALPIIPKHDQCPNNLNVIADETVHVDPADEPVAIKPNPFAVLATLKKH
ncbi:YceD family protein [Thioflexithrix psekupsensis]|uniref:Large ribosomal RNA subunit accumulation protein YceD n=1 Tax=Thioflexithrix psekupsensis TaxID=1570016 RepID=A0A251X4N8_9GAMM|nr:YceD family protein [Thioflexithrix psekupsensis]OUD12473.1 hypothetical protein TPSD3_15330 [Thioflexithrix psekupsensis]